MTLWTPLTMGFSMSELLSHPFTAPCYQVSVSCSSLVTSSEDGENNHSQDIETEQDKREKQVLPPLQLLTPTPSH